jgi:hypothetical protein
MAARPCEFMLPMAERTVPNMITARTSQRVARATLEGCDDGDRQVVMGAVDCH